MALPGAAPAFRGPRLQRRAGRQRRDERRRSCPAPPIRAPRWAGPAGAAAAPAGGAGRGAGPPRAGGGGAGRGLAGRRRGRAGAEGGIGPSAGGRRAAEVSVRRERWHEERLCQTRAADDRRGINWDSFLCRSLGNIREERAPCPEKREPRPRRPSFPPPPPRWEPHRVPPLLRKTEFSWGVSVSLGCRCGFCGYIFSAVITGCIIAWQQLLTAGSVCASRHNKSCLVSKQYANAQNVLPKQPAFALENTLCQSAFYALLIFPSLLQTDKKVNSLFQRGFVLITVSCNKRPQPNRCSSLYNVALPLGNCSLQHLHWVGLTLALATQVSVAALWINGAARSLLTPLLLNNLGLNKNNSMPSLNVEMNSH